MFIHDKEVEMASKYKYLGIIFDNKLKWDDNIEAIVKKGRQRLYFVRTLNSFLVDRTILTLFYKSFIESVLTFSLSCWYHSLVPGVKNKK